MGNGHIRQLRVKGLQLVDHVRLNRRHLEEIDEAGGGEDGQLAFVGHVRPCRRRRGVRDDRVALLRDVQAGRRRPGR